MGRLLELRCRGADGADHGADRALEVVGELVQHLAALRLECLRLAGAGRGFLLSLLGGAHLEGLDRLGHLAELILAAEARQQNLEVAAGQFAHRAGQGGERVHDAAPHQVGDTDAEQQHDDSGQLLQPDHVRDRAVGPALGGVEVAAQVAFDLADRRRHLGQLRDDRAGEHLVALDAGGRDLGKQAGIFGERLLDPFGALAIDRERAQLGNLVDGLDRGVDVLLERLGAVLVAGRMEAPVDDLDLQHRAGEAVGHLGQAEIVAGREHALDQRVRHRAHGLADLVQFLVVCRNLAHQVGERHALCLELADAVFQRREDLQPLLIGLGLARGAQQRQRLLLGGIRLLQLRFVGDRLVLQIGALDDLEGLADLQDARIVVLY